MDKFVTGRTTCGRSYGLLSIPTPGPARSVIVMHAKLRAKIESDGLDNPELFIRRGVFGLTQFFRMAFERFHIRVKLHVHRVWVLARVPPRPFEPFLLKKLSIRPDLEERPGGFGGR